MYTSYITKNFAIKVSNINLFHITDDKKPPLF